MEILRGLGLPLPAPVRRAASGETSLLAYPKLAGEDLRYALPGMSAAQRTRLAEQVTEFQRVVAAGLPLGAAYGWTPIGVPGPFASWPDLVWHELGRPPGIPWANEIHIEAAEKALRLNPYLSAVPPTPFLDDLTIKNVIVQEGALSGVVDFDVICYGDPLYALALTEAAIVLDLGLEFLDYAQELRRLANLTAAQTQVLDLYAIICGLAFVRSLPDGGRDTDLREWLWVIR